MQKKLSVNPDLKKQDTKKPNAKSDSLQTFSSRLAVAKWLRANGWKVSRSTLYNQFGRTKLLPREDGLIHMADVQEYARVFLRRRTVGMPLPSRQDELQQEKAKLEVQRLRIEVDRAEHRREIEEGKYIPKDQFELEMASRAAVLDAGIAHFFQSEAGAWIDLVGGDQRKLPELIEILMAAKDRFLDQYARSREFLVEFGEG